MNEATNNIQAFRQYFDWINGRYGEIAVKLKMRNKTLTEEEQELLDPILKLFYAKQRSK